MIKSKNSRPMLACLLIVIVLPTFCGCVYSIPEDETTNGLYISGSAADLCVPETLSYFYDQLTDIEKSVYIASVAALESGVCEFEFVGVNCDQYSVACKRAVEALLRDHPEFFWIDGGYQIESTNITGQNDGSTRIILTDHSFWQKRDISAARKMLEYAVAELIVAANQFNDPYDKVKFVNDWLAENVEYDEKSLIDPTGMTEADKAFVNTVYGTLVERRTLCGGYAYTFSYIMNRLGIETLYITGATCEGLHAWNAVKLGGDYYYIDVTWADDNQNDNVVYTYFCLDGEEMSRTHITDELFTYPEATANEYNYFIREGLYLDTYSFNKYNTLFLSHRFEKVFSVKFPSQVVLNAAVSEIIENSKFYKLSGMESAGSFSYTVDEIHYILTLYP